MSEHKDAVYFDEGEHRHASTEVKAAYRELRLWQKGYLAAVEGGYPNPGAVADEYVEAVNAKRSALLG